MSMPCVQTGHGQTRTYTDLHGLFLLSAICYLLSAACLLADEDWVSLFNGKDLDGWIVKIRGYEVGNNFGNTFRVEDGVLKVCYDQYEKFDNRFGHIFYKEPFSNYVLRVEYRFTGKQVAGGAGWARRNSGIMIHGQSPESMGKDQSFPVSIEVQMLGGFGQGKRTTANLCTPGTHVVMGDQIITRHCTNSTSETYHGDQWVTMDVEVHGNGTIKHIIDGKVVMEYQRPHLDEKDGSAKKLLSGRDSMLKLTEAGSPMLKGGSISLQSESHPVEFRKVLIRKLDE